MQQPLISRRQLLLAGTAALAAPKATLAAQKSKYGITGHMAPPLQINDWIDGDGNPTSFSLEAQRGKFVLMKFWQAWCPGCMSKGFPSVQKLYSAFGDSEFFTAVAIQTTFEGYSYNTADKMRDMQVRFQLPITMGHEAGDKATHRNPSTMRNYRSGGTPWLVLVSPQGKVLFNAFHLNDESAVRYLDQEINKLSA